MKNRIAISCLESLAITLALMIFAGSAMADTDAGPSSNRTLSGPYGFAIEGMILAIHGRTLQPPPPFRAVAITTFDGKGNLTQIECYVVAGTPRSNRCLSSRGTYTVNANCAGSLTLNEPGNPSSPFNLDFVGLESGKEVRTVVDSNLLSGVGSKIE